MKVVKKVISVIFMVLFISWLSLIVYESYMVTRGEQPKFCIKKEEHKYNDGVTTECLGLGYKVYMYDRSSIEVQVEFGPFWISEKK
mgnify:CR=1 FL=1